MAYDNFLIDKRVVERNITKGLVDPATLKRQIDGLPDSEANCVQVSLEGEAATADDLDDAFDDDLDEEGDEEGDEEDDEDSTED